MTTIAQSHGVVAALVYTGVESVSPPPVPDDFRRCHELGLLNAGRLTQAGRVLLFLLGYEVGR